MSETPAPDPELEAAFAAIETQRATSIAIVTFQSDIARTIAEAAIGHKRALTEAGFCEEHAEHAAMQVHTFLMVRNLGPGF